MDPSSVAAITVSPTGLGETSIESPPVDVSHFTIPVVRSTAETVERPVQSVDVQNAMPSTISGAYSPLCSTDISCSIFKGPQSGTSPPRTSVGHPDWLTGT